MKLGGAAACELPLCAFVTWGCDGGSCLPDTTGTRSGLPRQTSLDNWKAGTIVSLSCKWFKGSKRGGRISNHLDRCDVLEVAAKDGICRRGTLEVLHSSFVRSDHLTANAFPRAF